MRKIKKIKYSNVLILLGLIVISLNIFFIVIVDPLLISNRISKAWELDAKEIQENNKKDFEISELSLQVLDSNEVKNEFDRSKVVGYISIPNVDLSLPILRGATSENLNISATTVLENQIMGVGNYPVAGHRTVHADTLFSPLASVKENDEIYLTNKEYIYKYKVSSIEIVTPESIEVLDQTEEYVVVTLITCYGKKSEFRRIVKGVLIDTLNYTDVEFEQFFRK